VVDDEAGGHVGGDVAGAGRGVKQCLVRKNLRHRAETAGFKGAIVSLAATIDGALGRIEIRTAAGIHDVTGGGMPENSRSWMMDRNLRDGLLR
jgi:hypothetical protein